MKQITYIFLIFFLCSCSLTNEDHSWYPFPFSLLDGVYSAGPIALTNDFKKDQALWDQINILNLSLARMSYMMQLGSPDVDVAWLMQDGEWPDKSSFSSGNYKLNQHESKLSKYLNMNGLTYDRISRNQLLTSNAKLKLLEVGSAEYKALIIHNTDHILPELYKKISDLAKSGVPIIFFGELPSRASGFKDKEIRDTSILNLNKSIVEDLEIINKMSEIRVFLEPLINQKLFTDDDENLHVRVNKRDCNNEKILFLFNSSDEPIDYKFDIGSEYSNVHIFNPYNGSIKGLTTKNGEERVSIFLEGNKSKIISFKSDNSYESCWTKSMWNDPNREYFPIIRWWWPGNAVNKDQLEKELRIFKMAGFSGVEIQTLTIGLSNAHLKKNEQNIFKVGDASFFNNLKYVFSRAEELELDVDLTLGSGWSSGGPFIKNFPAQQLVKSEIELRGPLKIEVAEPSIEVPFFANATNWVVENTIGEFDNNLELVSISSAKIIKENSEEKLINFKDISANFDGNKLNVDLGAGKYKVFFIYQNDVSHNVLGSGYPNALENSLVIDHLNKGGIDEYLEKLGEVWLDGISPYKPRSFFVDSFELIGQLPWSDKFFEKFKEIHEYDLGPFLPLLFKEYGESKYLYSIFGDKAEYLTINKLQERVREDYIFVREYLFMNEFLVPMKNWMHEKEITLRMQAHGGFGDYLDAYAIADIPESEGLFGGGDYDFLKLAASAGHVSGKNTISSESFIKLSIFDTTISLDEFHSFSGHAFAAGINQIVFHGYAYDYKTK